MSVLSDEAFKQARKEYVEVGQPMLYRLLDGFYKEGILDEAKKLEAEIVQKNRYFGVQPPANADMPNVSIIELDTRTGKTKRVF